MSKIGVSPIKWGSKLLICVILRHLISANIFGTEQTIYINRSRIRKHKEFPTFAQHLMNCGPHKAKNLMVPFHPPFACTYPTAILRQHIGLSANIFGTKRAIDKGKYDFKAQRTHVGSLFSENLVNFNPQTGEI